MNSTITRKAYLTDLTESQWTLLRPLLKLPDGGAPKTTDYHRNNDDALLLAQMQDEAEMHASHPQSRSATAGGYRLLSALRLLGL